MGQPVKESLLHTLSENPGPVRLGDIVASTGLPTLLVSKQLNSIAYETGAHLDVDACGQLIYDFPTNLSWRYRTSLYWSSFRNAYCWLLSILQQTLRISFGIIMAASIMLFYGLGFTILTILSTFTGMSSSTTHMRGEFFALIYFLCTNGNGRQTPSGSKRAHQFLEDCFTFLFGTPDPNKELVEARWKLIAKFIKSHGSLVISEELEAFFMDHKDPEKALIEILVRLDGIPIVSDQGTIAYYFPALSNTSEASDGKPNQNYLTEKTWHFTGLTNRKLVPVLALAITNAVGSNVTYLVLQSFPSLAQQAALYWTITVLWIYGNTYIMLPAVRFFICVLRNHRIITQNANRKLKAESCLNPTPELASKLEDANNLRTTISEFYSENIVFSTRQDSLEQLMLENASIPLLSPTLL